jgi:RNA polymerase sigma factor (sigma-70 family)
MEEETSGRSAMPTGTLSKIVRHLHRAALRGGAGDVADGCLLEAFVLKRDEAAFAALLRRHGPMVLGLCRRVLGCPHDADDAFQATFLVLARKAASVVPRERVGPWLYGVAYRTACKARAAASRRRAVERQGALLPEPAAPAGREPADWLPLLDRELQRLPERYRAPVVLCELEGRSRKEAARMLCLAEGTVSSRLARARRLLARRLRRCGFALSAVSLALVLKDQVAANVPPSLRAATMQTLSGSVPSNAVAGACSARVAALTEGVIKAMWISKLKTVGMLALVVALVAGGAVALAGRVAAQKPSQADKNLAGDKNGKGKAEQGTTVQGTVQAVDADKHSLTVAVRVSPTEKKTEDKTFAVAKDAKVVLENSRTKEQPAGRLADVTAGAEVILHLAADGKTVVALSARAADVQGSVKSVDAANNKLTVVVKEKDGPTERTFTLAKGAKVLLNDGLKKNTKDKEAELTELTEGTRVRVQPTVDRKTALTVRVQGATVHGTLKGVDVGNNTLTVTVKEDAQVVDKTLAVAKDARLDGKLADLPAGSRVSLQMSVFDKNVVVGVHVHKEGEE